MSATEEPEMANIVQHLTPAERAAQGREARKSVPRTWHGDWDVAQRRLEPLDLLAEQATTRLPELVPVRHGRMAASPFAYYRGAALPMAADLATLPNTGLRVQLCGDAHLCNFGGFASPERDLVFDVNDFDETAPGPFEWDLKRLCASLEIAARSRGFDPKTSRDMSLAGARAYQRAIREFAGMPALDVWYTHLDVEGVIARWGATVTPKRVQAFRRLAQNATAKNEIKARAKLTKPGPDGLRFRSDPPLLVPIRDLWDEAESEATIVWVHELIRSYRRTLEDNRRHLLETYRFADLARKVVGVGSVGTRSWVALFVGRDENDTLILQVKEAEASVLERFAGRSPYRNHGQRVVAGQRLMQAASDIFLGWHRVAKGIDGAQHDYYVRQLWDWKVSADVDTMPPDVMAVYAQMCGWTLARAHARSGDPLAIGSYIGSSDTLPLALAQFASAYADQNDTDYQALHNAINDGTVQADTTV
jgi:uncharacterized protein (DUF2252 family)